LLKDFLDRVLMQEMEDICQWEAVLLGQGNVKAVISGAGLQFKIEGNAETLAQCQSPGLVDAGAKGGMDHKLHAAAFVKETLSNDALHGGHGSQHRPASNDVFNGLLRAGIVEAALLLQPRHGMQ